MAAASRPAIAVIGAGRLARALLPSLRRAGYPIVAVCSRRIASARAAGRGLGPLLATTSPTVAARDARLLLLAVPDDALLPLARRLARRSEIDWRERVVLHHAGALGPEPLAALARAGAAVGVLHPLQCLGGRRAEDVLRGSRARIEGDPRARRWARRIARDLGWVPLRLGESLRPADRRAYHGAASLLSNDLLALLELGTDFLASTGLDRGEARKALLALAQGTLRQVELEGPGGALTGPVLRGDVATLAAQLDRLGRAGSEAGEVHRLLSLRLARLARTEGRAIAPRVLRELRRPRRAKRR